MSGLKNIASPNEKNYKKGVNITKPIRIDIY